MNYSMDSDPMHASGGAAAAANHHRQSPPSSSSTHLPPAYAFQRSERASTTGGRPGSFATHTTEDSIDQSMDQSVDYTEDLSTSGGTYEGLQHQQQSQQQRQQQIGSDGDLNQYYQYQEAQEGYVDQNNLSTVNEYQTMASNNGSEGDATVTIYQMHKKLLHLLSCPELFHDALNWQSELDKGIDPANTVGAINTTFENKDVSLLTTFETEFEDDSTFKGLHDNDAVDEQENTKTAHSNNETFEFNPNNNESEKEKPEEASTTFDDAPKPKEPPLPHQIFASDAEVVLPQALTASQLFGIERVTGIELEAAAGMVGLSQLFLRWLALMPEGDHMNVIDPPGLTVMKIYGGGYRVTGAHRVVWRWMNKFSPVSTSVRDPNTGKSTNETDFDFGDLVTMTIIDVFETDVNGKLLSYCPTFDNRAVHKTPEMAERLRKGASQLKERMEVVANSPAGKSVNMAAGRLGQMSFRAALVVGNAVKNKIQHHNQQNANADVPDEDQLHELLQSQIATDERDVDTSAVNAAALEEDPTSSPNRHMEV
eukprot:CAMPEP_0172329496 /NCGR_PEP_ID=MMETSP1058-20130122/60912_1 /TAXON_ID=83371 /ORGANISM="Detonula confervacea, Strain CCMP 353" /LENGTH=538 /DNA_ID=CAMNT_0013046675 /DNA_START=122 /DNA_END=1738 /DNA_ORIENTATION=+